MAQHFALTAHAVLGSDKPEAVKATKLLNHRCLHIVHGCHYTRIVGERNVYGAGERTPRVTWFTDHARRLGATLLKACLLQGKVAQQGIGCGADSSSVGRIISRHP